MCLVVVFELGRRSVNEDVCRVAREDGEGLRARVGGEVDMRDACLV